MNLLVTNTRNPQAYFIIRALRPHADKIVVTMYGKNRLVARLSHAANSRLVDKRYYVPSPVEDWRAGKIQRENTEREEAYIQAVLKICEKEKIDTIFPSHDPQVYVFSKNKERFERIGVLIPVPDYEVVITPLDKYRTIKAAEEVRFPCPKTYLPESEVDLKRIAEELGFPLVIKLRVTSVGRGMALVTDFQELVEKTRLASVGRGTPMIQEYIPGRHMQHLRLIYDKKGHLKVASCPIQWRDFPRITLNMPTAVESSTFHPYVAHATRLVQQMGLWGYATLQTKIDPRDGIPKLMEINAKLGYRLWETTGLGINVPLLCLQIAQGRDIEALKNYPAGIMLLDPVEDVMELGFRLLDLLIYKFRIGVQGKAPVDPLNSPMSLRELFHSYCQTYCRDRKKIFNPYSRYFFQDPLVSLLWWCQFFTLLVRFRNELGK